jgi:hypothetical protein
VISGNCFCISNFYCLSLRTPCDQLQPVGHGVDASVSGNAFAQEPFHSNLAAQFTASSVSASSLDFIFFAENDAESIGTRRRVAPEEVSPGEVMEQRGRPDTGGRGDR